MAAWAIRATSRSSTSTGITVATASPKAARKSRSARSRAFCSAIWERRSIEGGDTTVAVIASQRVGAKAARSQAPRSNPATSGKWIASSLTLFAMTARRSIHLPVLADPIGIAQVTAQDLAGGVAGQGVDEIDRLRRLEDRDALAGKADNVRRRRRLAWLHHH